jgi:hypothetical protein
MVLRVFIIVNLRLGLMNYLHWLGTTLYFVAASRNGDLHLHLQAGKELRKLFCAWMEKLKYKWLWQRYIADIHALKTEHSNRRSELEKKYHSDSK